MSELLFEQRARVAIITLNRPEFLNAFTRELRVRLRDTLLRVAEDPGVGAVVLTGAGRGFSAGADLKSEAMTSGAAVEQMLVEEYGPSLTAIATMPKPVVAAVNGFATGIGASFALVCDLVVMGEKAFFQVPFAQIGLVPDGGMTWQLADRLGHQRAFELAIGGERVPAARCLDWGLVNRVVPDERVVSDAVTWAGQLCEAAPIALREMKQLLRGAARAGLERTMRDEARMQASCIDSQDFVEGVAAFREKRAPKFTGK